MKGNVCHLARYFRGTIGTRTACGKTIETVHGKLIYTDEPKQTTCTRCKETVYFKSLKA